MVLEYLDLKVDPIPYLLGLAGQRACRAVVARRRRFAPRAESGARRKLPLPPTPKKDCACAETAMMTAKVNKAADKAARCKGHFRRDLRRRQVVGSLIFRPLWAYNYLLIGQSSHSPFSLTVRRSLLGDKMNLTVRLGKLL